MNNDIISLKLKDDETKQVVDNTLSVYWQMLGEIESKTNPEKDILNRCLVEGAYRHWNKLFPSNKPLKPRWEK